MTFAGRNGFSDKLDEHKSAQKPTQKLKARHAGPAATSKSRS